MTEIYIGFISFSVNHSEFCVYDEQFVTEVVKTFVDESEAVAWVKSHGDNFKDRRDDQSAVVAENEEESNAQPYEKSYFAIKVEVGTKQRIRVSDFHGYYSE